MTVEGCAECGYDFGWDRTSLLTRCDAFPIALQDMLATADPARVRRRTATGLWAPIEYGAHLGEAVHWYVGRIRRVLDEDRPRLEPFDFDAAAEEGEYGDRSVGDVVADVRTACRELADIARAVSTIQLRRCGLGSDGSPRSAESLLVRAEHEVVHHELDLRRGLGLLSDF
jgi:hypothetical protein